MRCVVVGYWLRLGVIASECLIHRDDNPVKTVSRQPYTR